MGATYIIGTRDSLLATTQTELIRLKLEAQTDDKFELLTMKTQGDLQTDRPLWQLDGKNFFTKELDQALLNREVDFVVSSYKDLSSDRPSEICLAAITERSYSNDILLIRKEVIDNLDQISTLIVGTSSPRRVVNIEKHLANYLPCPGIKVECRSLRGNVNTRISKLRDGDYHAIVLAHAGIERLAQREDSLQILTKLLKDIDFMILPEKIFPSAPAQGALAIECLNDRGDNGKLKDILATLNCSRTICELAKEREHFRSFGGGCHLAVGIFVKKVREHFIHVLVGEHNNQEVSRIFLESDRGKTTGKKAFIGLAKAIDGYLHDQLIVKEPLEKTNISSKHLFATSARCLDCLEASPSTLWVSGDKTFKTAVSKGLWVNGSADSLGEQEIEKLLKSKSLQLMISRDSLKVLTSDSAKSNIGTTIPCYTKRVVEVNDDYIEELKKVETFYWTSFSQYQIFEKHFPFISSAGKIHCCGVGKTLNSFNEQNIKVEPFIGIDDFKKWFGGV